MSSYPFIIWTLQRTGSTMLANLLGQLSEYTATQHEPFNYWDLDLREYGHIYREWGKSRSPHALVKICQSRLLIKHMYDKFDDDFNTCLAEAAYSAGYRHIHLQRRNELARLASKGIAEAEGSWHPGAETLRVFSEVRTGARQLKPLDVDTLIREHEVSRLKRMRVSSIHRRRMRCLDVFYEDLYEGTLEQRRTNLLVITDFLNIDRSKVTEKQDAVDHCLLNKGQNTSDVLAFIPNLDALRASLTLHDHNHNHNQLFGV